ncbi:MAG: AAA family ATPase, partial [Rhodobacterales bacterium]
MSDDQISDALAAGRDPYAETNLAQPPTAPANPPGTDRWRKVTTAVCASDMGGDSMQILRRGTGFHKTIATAVRGGKTLFAFASDPADLSDVGRAMCGQVLTYPSLSQEMCIEVLRASHSATGDVAEDTLRDPLPHDADLRLLPMTVLQAAYRARTTIDVAKTLSTAAARLRKPVGKTLSEIVLGDAVAAPIHRIVADMRAWKTGDLDWDEFSSAILLKGPPGNDKTLLAEVLAGEIRATLVATSYAGCQRHGHQGDMLKALSRTVNEAIQSVPSVFCIDEIDSFTHRTSARHSNNYILGVVNGLLEHLSELNQTPGVIVIGATNHPDLVDPAILRPGRFDLHLEMGPPDRTGIIRLLRKELQSAHATFDVEAVANHLLGASAAQVTALIRDAKGLARSQAAPLAQQYLITAAGHLAPSPSLDVLWRTAVHEAGHVVVAHLLGLPPAERATITLTGGFIDLPSTPLETRSSALNRVAALLGGRAAEELLLGENSNGAGL